MKKLFPRFHCHFPGFLLLLVAPALLYSQGIIQGTVSDSTAKEVLVGANVLVVGTAIGGVTDIEGKFRIPNVAGGAHRIRISYLGYVTKFVSVNVSEGRTTIVNADLIPDVIEGNEVVITAQARGQVAAINQQITSTTIVSVVSEEKIKELPDANAAEAVGRLPGVSLIRSGGEASKVILRGLSDKFTSVTIDGVRIPPTDANARGLDLSAISQSSLAGVELFKALTADKDADAVAGSVNFVTRKAPTERTINIESKGNYNKLMNSYDQYDFSLRYGERFFDDILGLQVSGNIEKKNRSNERVNIDYNTSRNNSTEYYISDVVLEFTDEVRKRNNVSFIFDVNTPDSGSLKFSTSYNHTFRDFIVYTRNFPGEASSNQQVLYSGRTREQNVDLFSTALRGENSLLDLDITWGASFAQSLLDYPYDYNLDFLEPSRTDPNTGEVISGMRTPPAIKDQPELLMDFALNNFIAATCSTAFFRAEKNLDKEKTGYIDMAKTYNVSSSISGTIKIGGKYKDKDRLKESSELYSPYYLGYFAQYVKLADGSIVPKNLYGTRFNEFFTSFDTSNGLFRLPSAKYFVNYGSLSRNLFDRYRLSPILNKEAMREWYELNKNGVDATGNPEYFLDPTVDAEYYKVLEQVTSLYAMNTLAIGEQITVIAGVRAEYEKNRYDSKFAPQSIGGFPVPQGLIKDTTATYSETIILPNFHLALRPTEFINVRLAAYRALARPDFDHRLEKFIGSGGGGSVTLVLGNPKLKTAKAWNYELNTSFYTNAIGLISISAFYKEIDDMFHVLDGASVVGNELIDSLGIGWKTPHSGAYELTVPYNSAKPTKVWGFEFDHQILLNFLPGLFQHFILSYNASIVRSETFLMSTANATKYDSVDIGGGTWIQVPIPYTVVVESKQKLENQPEFYGNISLGYDFGGFSGRISLFHQAEYNRSFSGSGRSDLVNSKFTRIDVALKQKVTNNISLLFNVSNLTGVDEGFSFVNRVVGYSIPDEKERYDMTVDFGVRIEL